MKRSSAMKAKAGSAEVPAAPVDGKQPKHPFTRSKPIPALEPKPHPGKHPPLSPSKLVRENAALRRALEESDALLHKSAGLYDFAPVGFLTLNERGVIVESNQMTATLLGVERSRLHRRSLLPLVAAQSRQKARDFLKRVLAGPDREFCKIALASTAGPVRWVGLHGSLESVPVGSARRCWVAVSDLTNLRRADEDLRASETRYRRLFEAAHDGVLLLDPATRRITDANPFMTRLLGYTREELIGKELYEIGLLHDEAASQEMFRKLQRKHAVRYEDLPLADEDGRLHEVEVVANLYKEGGRPVIQCNIRDITQRKQTEELLRRNEALLASLVAKAPAGMYVVNSKFRLIQANPTACAAFRNVHPLLGRDFKEVLRAVWPPRVAEQLSRRFRHTLRTGQFYQAPSFVARREDSGQRESYEWQIQQVPLPDGEAGVVCFFNDVTERNRLEAAAHKVAVLAAANAKLVAEVSHRKTVEQSLTQSRQQQARLLAEAQGLQQQLRHLSRSVMRAQEEERRLISRELHDVIAQMLTGINLRLGNLGLQAGICPADLKRTIAETQELVARSVETVHEFARELRPSVLDDLGLIPALTTYLKSFAARTGTRARLTACKEADLLSVPHRTALFRVAQEALTNVGRHASAVNVEVRLQQEPGGFSLHVVDDGRAFPVDRMLQSTRGQRLGLLGMRERLEMVGGRLHIQSKPGIGTTVIAHIPLPAAKPLPKS
jgi:PAS domain S-box-containing protein